MFFGGNGKISFCYRFSNIVIVIYLNEVMTLATGGVSNKLLQQACHCLCLCFKRQMDFLALFFF